MNKKGIMLDFLVTVILALIIFIPACYGISKFFRTSEQAEKSFQEFASLLEKVPELEDAKGSMVLIMDKGTYIIGYSANKPTQLCTAQNECGASFYPEQCGGKSCVCLCRETKAQGFSSSSGEARTEDISCGNPLCKQLDDVTFADGLVVSNFALDDTMNDVPNLANGYFKNGFIIARGDVEFSGFRYLFSDQRRQLIVVKASEGALYLCNRDEGCAFRSDLQ